MSEFLSVSVGATTKAQDRIQPAPDGPMGRTTSMLLAYSMRLLTDEGRGTSCTPNHHRIRLSCLTCPREESNLQHPPSEDGASARLGYADIDAEFPGPRLLPREPSRLPWSPTLEPGFSVAFTPCAKGLRTLDVATCFTAGVLPTARARGALFRQRKRLSWR